MNNIKPFVALCFTCLLACDTSPETEPIVNQARIVAPSTSRAAPSYNPLVCTKCREVQHNCTEGCTSAGCEAQCQTRYEDCTENAQCEWLPDECLGCVDASLVCEDECDTKYVECVNCEGRSCPSFCDEEATLCETACSQFFEICWKEEQCQPYTDVTAVCNYLDRGIHDFDPFAVDNYSIRPPGLSVLGDISKLDFGLDIPDTHCSAESHGVPCSDKDYKLEWFIDAVEVSVKGVTFFEESRGPQDQYLRRMTGGRGDDGIAGWTLAELKANSQWGLSEDEILSLATDLPIPRAGILPVKEDLIQAATSTLSANQLTTLVEAFVGDAFSAFVKTGDADDNTGCKDSTYCDNKRGNVVFLRRGDCDFGNCPPEESRLPSPSIEVRGVSVGGANDQDHLEVSIEFDVAKGKADSSDCLFGDSWCPGADARGTKYKERASYDLRLDLEPVCEWVGDKICLIDDNCKSSQICRIDPGESEGLCQNARVLLRPEYRLIREDSGVVVWLADALNGSLGWIFNLLGNNNPFDVDAVVTEKLNEFIKDFTVLSDLTSCPSPVAEVTTDGDLIFPVGTPGFSTGRSMPSDQLVRWGRVIAAPGTARATLESEVGATVVAADLHTDLPLAVTNEVIGASQAAVKQTMDDIDAALNAMCALTGFVAGDTAADDKFVCHPDMDISQVSLPPPSVGSYGDLLEACDPALPSGNAANDQACEELALLKAFFMQPEVREHCLLAQPAFIPALPLVAQLVWDGYLGALQACKDEELSVTQLIPAPTVDLKITTGREGASETFPFVDVSDVKGLSFEQHRSEKCHNRIEFELNTDPPDYDACAGDPDDPAFFGQPGCRCKDIEITSMTEINSDGGYPDGLGSYKKNGSLGMGQYCSDATEEVVCGLIVAGPSEAARCQRCGIETNVGCACSTTADCGGLEGNLRCVGSASEEGWPSGGQGTCLPDPGTPDGQEDLESMRWFCLDNCDGIDGYPSDSLGGCYFNQLGDQAEHGSCVSTLGACNGGAGSYLCEVDERLMCKTVNVGADVCEQECGPGMPSCTTLGFPSHYVCDNGDFSPGHCVPEACQNGNGNESFCYLYR